MGTSRPSGWPERSTSCRRKPTPFDAPSVRKMSSCQVRVRISQEDILRWNNDDAAGLRSAPVPVNRGRRGLHCAAHLVRRHAVALGDEVGHLLPHELEALRHTAAAAGSPTEGRRVL